MSLKKIFLTVAILGAAIHSFGAIPTASKGKYFDRAIIVIFENTDYEDAVMQPFFKQLSETGVLFSNLQALTHPSQGNYIALTSGALNGVTGDGNYDLDVKNVVDLFDAKGITWKVYVEGYPGNCFTGKSSRKYVRKHNPFISYVDIQKNTARCANIVEASQFDRDAASGALPQYAFYVPDIDNDAHDTGVAFADKWYSKKFSPYLGDARLMANTILISTFDENSSGWKKNRIYTSIVGGTVKPREVTDPLNTHSLLRLIEENWDLGNLGKQDATAAPIPNIW